MQTLSNRFGKTLGVALTSFSALSAPNAEAQTVSHVGSSETKAVHSDLVEKPQIDKLAPVKLPDIAAIREFVACMQERELRGVLDTIAKMETPPQDAELVKIILDAAVRIPELREPALKALLRVGPPGLAEGLLETKCHPIPKDEVKQATSFQKCLVKSGPSKPIQNDDELGSGGDKVISYLVYLTNLQRPSANSMTVDLVNQAHEKGGDGSVIESRGTASLSSPPNTRIIRLGDDRYRFVDSQIVWQRDIPGKFHGRVDDAAASGHIGNSWLHNFAANGDHKGRNDQCIFAAWVALPITYEWTEYGKRYLFDSATELLERFPGEAGVRGTLYRFQSYWDALDPSTREKGLKSLDLHRVVSYLADAPQSETNKLANEMLSTILSCPTRSQINLGLFSASSENTLNTELQEKALKELGNTRVPAADAPLSRLLLRQIGSGKPEELLMQAVKTSGGPLVCDILTSHLLHGNPTASAAALQILGEIEPTRAAAVGMELLSKSSLQSDQTASLIPILSEILKEIRPEWSIEQIRLLGKYDMFVDSVQKASTSLAEASPPLRDLLAQVVHQLESLATPTATQVLTRLSELPDGYVSEDLKGKISKTLAVRSIPTSATTDSLDFPDDRKGELARFIIEKLSSHNFHVEAPEDETRSVGEVIQGLIENTTTALLDQGIRQVDAEASAEILVNNELRELAQTATAYAAVKQLFGQDTVPFTLQRLDQDLSGALSYLPGGDEAVETALVDTLSPPPPPQNDDRDPIVDLEDVTWREISLKDWSYAEDYRVRTASGAETYEYFDGSVPFTLRPIIEKHPRILDLFGIDIARREKNVMSSNPVEALNILDFARAEPLLALSIALNPISKESGPSLAQEKLIIDGAGRYALSSGEIATQAPFQTPSPQTALDESSPPEIGLGSNSHSFLETILKPEEFKPIDKALATLGADSDLYSRVVLPRSEFDGVKTAFNAKSVVSLAAPISTIYAEALLLEAQKLPDEIPDPYGKAKNYILWSEPNSMRNFYKFDYIDQLNAMIEKSTLASSETNPWDLDVFSEGTDPLSREEVKNCELVHTWISDDLKEFISVYQLKGSNGSERLLPVSEKLPSELSQIIRSAHNIDPTIFNEPTIDIVGLSGNSSFTRRLAWLFSPDGAHRAQRELLFHGVTEKQLDEWSRVPSALLEGPQGITRDHPFYQFIVSLGPNRGEPPESEFSNEIHAQQRMLIDQVFDNWKVKKDTAMAKQLNQARLNASKLAAINWEQRKEHFTILFIYNTNLDDSGQGGGVVFSNQDFGITLLTDFSNYISTESHLWKDLLLHLHFDVDTGMHDISVEKKGIPYRFSPRTLPKDLGLLPIGGKKRQP